MKFIEVKLSRDSLKKNKTCFGNLLLVFDTFNNNKTLSC